MATNISYLEENNLAVSYNGVRISARRSGNTTRIVDNVVEQLFSGKKVVIRDYPDTKRIEDAENLGKKVLRRLRFEHDVSFDDVLVIYNKHGLIYQLKCFDGKYLNAFLFDEMGCIKSTNVKHRWQVNKEILKNDN